MNDDNNNIFGELLEQGAAQVKQGASDAASQITGQNIGGSDSAQVSPKADANTADIVDSLYEKSSGQVSNQAPQPQVSSQAQNPHDMSSKSAVELAQMEAVRKQLHNEYYQHLVNPPKQQEETVVEKIEREDQEKDWELKKKEMEAPPPLAVQRAQEHAEKFPGASG